MRWETELWRRHSKKGEYSLSCAYFSRPSVVVYSSYLESVV